jgi:hypothetical protein
MTKTRKQSAIETVAGVAIGFTVLSIARGYAVRRLFNRWGRE